MIRLVNGLIGLGLVLWTLLGLGAWAMIGPGGDVIRSYLPALFGGHPEPADVVGGVLAILQGLGIGLVVFAWAVGAALILAFGMIFRRLARAVEESMEHASLLQERYPDERTMKDITPPQTRRPDPPQPQPRLPGR